MESITYMDDKCFKLIEENFNNPVAKFIDFDITLPVEVQLKDKETGVVETEIQHRIKKEYLGLIQSYGLITDLAYEIGNSTPNCMEKSIAIGLLTEVCKNLAEAFKEEVLNGSRNSQN